MTLTDWTYTFINMQMNHMGRSSNVWINRSHEHVDADMLHVCINMPAELTKCNFARACKQVRPCATFERAHLAELYVSLCQVR